MDIEQNKGSICVFSDSLKIRMLNRKGILNSFPDLKFWSGDIHLSAKLTDINDQMNILTSSAIFSDSALTVWKSHLELLQKLALKDRCIKIDGNWDSLYDIIETVSSILLDKVSSWESGLIDFYDPLILAFCCCESKLDGTSNESCIPLINLSK